MEAPYRVKALLTGDMSRANFRVDLAALQEQLGECAFGRARCLLFNYW